MRVLITAGGTREPIDAVRALTNSSTGKTGRVIAEQFYADGWQTVFVAGREVSAVSDGIERHNFVTFQQLRSSVMNLLARDSFDLVIHLAAVSDYSVARVCDDQGQELDRSEKISSDYSHLQVTLVRNPKLIAEIVQYVDNRFPVIAFKLTQSAELSHVQAQINKLQSSANVSWVVHNDLTEITANQHIATIYHGDRVVVKTQTKLELARQLIKLFRGKK